MTARYWTAQFEWQAHARLARQASLGQEVIDAIAERRTPIFSDPDAIYGWFTEGFDTPDLKEAKALLDELG